MADKYDVIIIGAGIGGLTAGNILAKNGMKVLILEKNHIPGGAVTTYYRNGYPIDISHSLCGLREGSPIRQMFDYIDITKNLDLIELEKSFIYVKEDRRPIYCYSDFKKFKEELRNHFPNAGNKLNAYFDQVTKIWGKEVLDSYYNPSKLLLLTYPFRFPSLFKYRNITFDKFIERFSKNKEIKDVLSVGWPYLGLKAEATSALYMICMIGAYHNDKSYFVKGGFGRIVEELTTKFQDLGGEIRCNQEVIKILINKRASVYGIKDLRGNIILGSRVISNVDTKKTFLKLLFDYTSRTRLYKRVKRLKMSCSVVHVHFVAKAEIANEFLSTGSILLPSNLDLEINLKKASGYPFRLDIKHGLAVNINYLNSFNINAEKDHFVFNVFWLPADYYLWKRFFSIYGKKGYEDLKTTIVQETVFEMKKYFEIKDVKFSNVLTPLSFEKWLGASKGAIYDTQNIPSQVLINRFRNKTVFNNFYLVGAKTCPGASIASSVISAFSLGDIILDKKLTDRKFKL